MCDSFFESNIYQRLFTDVGIAKWVQSKYDEGFMRDQLDKFSDETPRAPKCVPKVPNVAMVSMVLKVIVVPKPLVVPKVLLRLRCYAACGAYAASAALFVASQHG